MTGRECGREESSLKGGTYPIVCSIRTFTKYSGQHLIIATMVNHRWLLCRSSILRTSIIDDSIVDCQSLILWTLIIDDSIINHRYFELRSLVSIVHHQCFNHWSSILNARSSILWWSVSTVGVNSRSLMLDIERWSLILGFFDTCVCVHQ